MKLSVPSKKMILVICISALILMAGGAVLCLAVGSLPSREALPFALGVLLTSALNVLKVYMLERTVQKAVGKADAASGKNFVRFQYLIRYFLTGLVLVAAALIPFINIWGAIIGVFTLQISIVVVRSMKLDNNT